MPQATGGSPRGKGRVHVPRSHYDELETRAELIARLHHHDRIRQLSQHTWPMHHIQARSLLDDQSLYIRILPTAGGLINHSVRRSMIKILQTSHDITTAQLRSSDYAKKHKADSKARA